MPAASYPIAVLVSGRGSNLQALIDAQCAGVLPAEIVLAASDKAHAPGLRRAEAAGIATLALDPANFASRADYDAALFARVTEFAPRLIVLAGFMRVLDSAAIAPWRGRMINIHPSLLPQYPGLKTHSRVLEAGATEHGASVHFVTTELDGGPVIAHARTPVLAHDTPAALAARVLALEHRLLPAVVALFAASRIVLTSRGVALDGVPLKSPLRLATDATLIGA